MTQTLNVSEARQQFSQLLNKVFRGETRVVGEKSGIPVAAIVSAEDLEQLRKLEEERRERFKLLGRMRAAFAGLTEEQIEEGVAEVIARVREKERAGRSSPRTA